MLLITGASGFVGQHLLAYLDSARAGGATLPDGEILPAWRSRALKCGVQLDLRDSGATLELLAKYPVSAVVHLAAEARTGVCEQQPELAVSGNVDATRNLLEACEASADPGDPLPYFLYISTDMVFRGDRPPYRADSMTDAVSAYGRSKADAEKLVQGYKGPWAIVRPALIYGAPCGGRVSVVSATLDAIESGSGAFFEDEIRTPVFVNDLVRLIEVMLKERGRDIVNAGGPDQVSRYDFALAVADTCGIPATSVKRGRIGDDPQHAWRPRDISMISDVAHGMVAFTPLTAGLQSIAAGESKG